MQDLKAFSRSSRLGGGMDGCDKASSFFVQPLFRSKLLLRFRSLSPIISASFSDHLSLFLRLCSQAPPWVSSSQALFSGFSIASQSSLLQTDQTHLFLFSSETQTSSSLIRFGLSRALLSPLIEFSCRKRSYWTCQSYWIYALFMVMKMQNSQNLYCCVLNCWIMLLICVWI
ncbi:Uncharacterized protein Rs2_09920 [Raphanus sativus]|nr:Uncharacterized protein Rs2_09920 [Raphanus sativus]